MKEKINEEKIMGILYANFRGKNKKIHDWIYLAEQIKKLSEHYGSYHAVAKNLEMSDERIREILKLLELSNEVQQLVKEGKLKPEIAWRIASISDKQKQNKIAREIVELDVHSGRDIARIYRKNPDIDITKIISKFKESKKKIENINLVVLPLREFDYLRIKKEASKFKKNPEEFILEEIINKWLDKERK